MSALAATAPAPARGTFSRRQHLTVARPSTTAPSERTAGAAFLEEAHRELASYSMATGTRRGYEGHQAEWVRWCENSGVDPRSATPHDVALHLTSYLLGGEDDAVRGPDGQLLAAIATSTLQVRLAAIDKWFEVDGRARPGHDLEVRTLMQGVRRLFGVATTRAKKPVLLADLRLLLAVVRQAQLRPRRDLVLLEASRQLGATPGQLARLDWTDVDLSGADAYLTLPPDRRGGSRRRVRLRASAAHGRCPVEALRTLHEAVTADGTAVFGDDAGRRLTRQAIDKRLRTAASVGVAAPRASTKALRDAAMLTVGWFAALRRSNLAALNWSDLTWAPDGSIRVRLRRSKTDQQGAGAWNWLPALSGDAACPVAALTAWRERVEELIGADPRQLLVDQPLFPAMDRHDHLKRRGGRLQRLRGEAVNELIQDLAFRAGLAAPGATGASSMGGHSLRAGFVTQACISGLPLIEIAKVTHHADVRSLGVYYRPTDRSSEKTIAAVVAGAVGS